MAKKEIINTQAHYKFPFILVVLLLVLIYVAVAYFLPMPEINASAVDLQAPKNTTTFSWPNKNESAVGVTGYGVISTNGEQTSKPIASIAKTVLALAVLKEKPLKIGEQGPSITMTDQDVKFYKDALAQNGSVVPVEAKEVLSEYQVLQALLIPSGDNIADTLAVWAFGSTNDYLTYANKMVSDMGLKNTHMADASGLSPQSVSSAEDLVIFGETFMQNPVLAEIVGQDKVTLPIVGEVKNYNTQLGQNGVVGIKTGNTDEAGGCLLFSAKENIAGKDIIVVGAILGDTNRYQVLIDTNTFLKNNVANFKFVTLVKAGQVVGTYSTPWGKKIDILAKEDLTILSTDEKLEIKTSFDSTKKSLAKDTQVGTISAEYGQTKVSVPAVLKDKISRAPIWWKVFHP